MAHISLSMLLYLLWVSVRDFDPKALYWPSWTRATNRPLQKVSTFRDSGFHVPQDVNLMALYISALRSPKALWFVNVQIQVLPILGYRHVLNWSSPGRVGYLRHSNYCRRTWWLASLSLSWMIPSFGIFSVYSSPFPLNTTQSSEIPTTPCSPPLHHPFVLWKCPLIPVAQEAYESTSIVLVAF